MLRRAGMDALVWAVADNHQTIDKTAVANHQSGLVHVLLSCLRTTNHDESAIAAAQVRMMRPCSAEQLLVDERRCMAFRVSFRANHIHGCSCTESVVIEASTSNLCGQAWFYGTLAFGRAQPSNSQRRAADKKSCVWQWMDPGCSD